LFELNIDKQNNISRLVAVKYKNLIIAYEFICRDFKCRRKEIFLAKPKNLASACKALARAFSKPAFPPAYLKNSFNFKYIATYIKTLVHKLN